MKRLKITLLGLMLIAVSAYAATVTWTFDKAHSKIEFTVQHMKISEVSGHFEKYDGSITTEGKNEFEGAEVNMTIDASSINTGNDKRDGHLKSEDFFYTEKYPKIKFESTKLTKEKGNEYRLVGNLTIRGNTNKETFKAIHNGTIKDPFTGKPKSGWKIKGSINRYDYGLKWDKTTEAGNLIAGKQVEINCDVELTTTK